MRDGPRPVAPPASSSAVKQSTSGRAGTAPARARARTRREQHRVEVLHVDRAAAPDAVRGRPDLAGERVHGPVLGARRVRRPGGRAAARARPLSPPQRATTDVRPGSDSNSSAVDADVVEQLGHVLGGLALSRAGLVAVVRGVDRDQVAADADDLGGRVVLGGGRVRGRSRRASCAHPAAGTARGRPELSRRRSGGREVVADVAGPSPGDRCRPASAQPELERLGDVPAGRRLPGVPAAPHLLGDLDLEQRRRPPARAPTFASHH